VFGATAKILQQFLETLEDGSAKDGLMKDGLMKDGPIMEGN
jgi:hypothetical protein